MVSAMQRKKKEFTSTHVPPYCFVGGFPFLPTFFLCAVAAETIAIRGFVGGLVGLYSIFSAFFGSKSWKMCFATVRNNQ